MYGYIYKTTNLITNKFYIGQKHSEVFLGEKYLGSGKRLNDSIKHYGKENFKVELIEEIESKELMDEREIYWIAYYNATNPDIGYNISEGGNVNRTMIGINNPFYMKKHSEESKKLMSEHNARPMLGKHHSEETKEKIASGNRGKVVSNEAREKLSLNAKNNPNYGMRGKPVKEETRLKLSIAKKGKPTSARGSIHITNDVEDKMVHEDELDYYLSIGWRKGRKKFTRSACENISKSHKGSVPANKGTKWMNNGDINKCVKADEIENYLNEGWVLGMLKKK